MSNIAEASSQIAAEARAAALAVGVQVRNELSVVRVHGDDRLSWLNGQITNDIRELAPGRSVYALAVNVRGKILADVWVTTHEDHLLVVMPASAEATVLESFERYIIMEDVALAPDESARVISVHGPHAQELAAVSPQLRASAFVADQLGVGGLFVIGNAQQEAALLQDLVSHATTLSGMLVTDQGFELARLRQARPRFGVDFNDSCYPQEAGLKGALSFNKGCYLGQEVVCTLENRGRLTRRLCVLETSKGVTLTPGDVLSTPSGDTCGHVTSISFDPEADRLLALGYVKRAHATIGETLHAGAHALQLGRSVGDND